jgi:hypothetical protein
MMRQILTIEATPGAPIACNMTNARDTPQERLAEYGRLFADAMLGRERTATGVEFRLASKPAIVEWVTDLVRREAACCPFFSYRLDAENDCIVWRTSSDAGVAAQAMLDEFYELPEHCADGIDGYFQRLEARGVAINSPVPGQYRILESSTDPDMRVPGLLGKTKARCGC